ncbi:MAG: hypothetical protein LBQ05_01845, partial [Christensenellaceae bacterium]|nr:hypothetical protein [Christensenellaceae bacterium]
MADVVVGSFAELRVALQNATAPTTIYLSNDITISSGITVPKTAGSIIIDGLYPLDGTGTIHSITDYNSGNSADTINVTAVSGAFDMTLQNLTFIGRNYYGMFYVQESPLNADITLTIKNVVYTGPQPIYNRNGITHIIDSNFTVDALNGTVCPVQEFGEVNSLILEGKVSVINNTNSSACLWFANQIPVFQIMPNAEISISVPNNYFIFADNPVRISFGANSSTIISTNTGMFYNADSNRHIASTVLIDTASSVTISQNVRNSGVPTIRIQTALTVNENASLYVATKFTPADAILQFTQGATINFNNPRSVVLYNLGGNVFNFPSVSSTVNVNAYLVAIWAVATSFPNAGGLDDVPLHAWQKGDNSIITVTATAAGSTTQNVTSNITTGDSGGAMDTATFDIANADVLSFGNLPLSLDEFDKEAVVITGSTVPNANVRAAYSGTVATGVADTGGNISLPLDVSVPITAPLTFKSNLVFLTNTITITKINGVDFTHLAKTLPFNDIAVPSNTAIIKRADSDWYME